ncbi:DNA-binding response OmpR family regulator [Devosia subaequoris]|uniref:DNA-binding response OmpR family regulator n=1 Tax=Devosia subaequoris TaxID=395930 RepID=A0A7W6NC46_9HYPH|nr:response regulator [Devosia subaequoris]MBB4052677.1 DNA-binding response OmpR family regulator [Devosia subaequoris]MCP1209832.1 response regulator [Devosia subaequoris]
MPSEQITKSGILIIDPQANMAALVAGMLRGLGRRDIREVNDASQAQQELRRRPFELVIIDDGLVKPDAVEIVRRLRVDAESMNRLAPVIMMSAAPDAARIAAARDAGVTEFLRKPFAANHLKSRLDSIAANPRPFVEGGGYSGPDRRRQERDVGTADRRSPNDPDKA